MKTIKNYIHKEYKNLKADDYFIGKITIIELVEKYKLKNKYTLKDEDINKYKTDGYIPHFHSRKDLEIGKTYEIRGYMYEDGYLRILVMKELEQIRPELEQCVWELCISSAVHNLMIEAKIRIIKLETEMLIPSMD